MARTTRDEWAKRVQRWERSGLTAEDFARKEGLRAGALPWWKWRLATTPVRRTAPPIIEVVALAAGQQPQTQTASFELVVRDTMRVVVPAGFDADSLRRLLSVLEGG